MSPHEELLVILEDANTPEKQAEAISQMKEYLNSLTSLRTAVQNLHKTASNSMINDDLDETAKGHRLGTVEVCEAILLMF